MKSILSFIIVLSLHSFNNTDKTNPPPKEFVGTWNLVSVESVAADNSISYPYGQAPAGCMMIDNNGNYMVEIYTRERANIQSGNKSTATPVENEMLVKGSNAHYGKFSADPAAKSLLYQPEAAFFPNWQGKELRSTYSLENDTLKSFSLNTTFGGAKAIVTWKKTGR